MADGAANEVGKRRRDRQQDAVSSLSEQFGMDLDDGLDHRLDLASTNDTIAMMAALAAVGGGPRGLSFREATEEPSWWQGYLSYLAPWNNPAPVDGWDKALHWGKWTFWGIGVTSAAGAGAAAATGVGSMTLSEVGVAVSATATSVGAEAYVVGTLTAAQIQRLIASSGDRVVTVFTKLTQSPAANRVLYTSTNPRLCEEIRRGTLYVGRIPADLFQRLVAENLIRRELTEMGGVRDYAVISAEAMRILHHYFEATGGRPSP
ncbi:MAG: hypothetical protein GXP27_15195 [Planctomycetes bacterium]|nr:hypothetical protein [Planctomycetota bacterium]